MREHVVNPDTLRCVMCGRNPFNRDRHPECDYVPPRKSMKHLSDSSLSIIESLMPPGSYYVVIVATKEGTGVDTNILDPAKAKEFVLETGNRMTVPEKKK